MNGGQGPYKKHVDFSEPVNLTTNEDDKPWWTASNGDETLFSGNYPLQKHDIAELILHLTSTKLLKIFEFKIGQLGGNFWQVLKYVLCRVWSL